MVALLAAALTALPALPPFTPAPAAAVASGGVPYALNAPVLTSAVGADGTVYVGGGFTTATPVTGGHAVTNQSDSALNFDFPNVTGNQGVVFAAIGDGSGGYFIGGDFTSVGGLPRSDLAHILSDGSVDPDWQPSVTGPDGAGVLALALHDNRLFVGGFFTGLGGQARTHAGSVNATTGAVTGWNPYFNGVVEKLAVGATGRVFLVGSFTRAGTAETVRNFASAFTYAGDTAALTGWNPGANGVVRSVAVSSAGVAPGEERVYLGGEFTTIGGIGRARLAGLTTGDGTGAQLLTGWNPGSNGTVWTLAAHGNTIYLGGGFGNVAGQSRSNAAAVSAGDTAGIRSGWNPAPNNLVWDIKGDGDTVYLGGQFSTVTGGSRARAAAFAADDTTTLRSWNPAFDNTVRTVLPLGGKTVVGGYFSTMTSAPTQPRAGLAAFGPTGQLSSWNPGASATVRALTVKGDTVYAGGDFGTVGGQSRQRLAAIGTDGQVTSWNPGTAGGGNKVFTLQADDDRVYVGGDFTSVAGFARGNLAAVSRATGQTVGNWNPGVAGGVPVKLDLEDGRLYLVGSFTSAGGQARNRAASVVAASGALTSWNPDLNDATWAVDAYQGAVYLGGEFTAVGGQDRRRLAAVTTGDTATVTPWTLAPTGGAVGGIMVHDDTVYFGGTFTSVDGQPRAQVASALADTTGSLTTWNPGLAGSFDSISAAGDAVYLGGNFNPLPNPAEVRPGFATRYFTAMEHRKTLGFEGGSGATGSMAPITGQAGITLPANGFDRPGWAFAGWATGPDGSGTVYQPGEIFDLTQTTILYAKWVQFQLQFDGNGSDGGTQVPAVTGAGTVTVPPNTFAKTNSSFSEWNTEPDGTGTDYDPGDSFPLAGNDTLYAIWSAVPGAPVIDSIAGGDKSLTVHFTAGPAGGSAITGYRYSTDDGQDWADAPGWSSGQTSFTVTKQSVGAGDQDLVNATTYPVRIRAVNAAGAGIASAVVDGTPFTTPAAPVITAIAPNDKRLIVSFTPGAANGSAIGNHQYSTDNGVSWVGFDPAQAGPDSVVITKQSTGAGDQELVNDTEYQVKLKAVNAGGAGAESNMMAGTPTFRTLTFAGGPGATGAMSPIQSYGPVTVPMNAFVKADSVFVGWNTAADGSGTTYQAWSSFTLTTDSTLYAQWETRATIPVNLNGSVNASAIGSDGTTYVGGSFTGLSAATGPSATFSATTGVLQQRFPGMVDGEQVFTAIPDGNGGFYVGGVFSSVGGKPRNSLAHILADGSVDPAWTPSTNAVVLSLQLVGDRIYLGGNFTQVNGQSRGFAAAVSATSGDLLPWNPAITGSNVEQVAVAGDRVYVIGNYTHVKGGIARSNAAAFTTGDDAALTAWNPGVTGGIPFRMIVHGNRVFLGGNFTQVGGEPRSNAASVDATTGQVTTWNAAPNGIPWAFAVKDDVVYLVGGFTQVKQGSGTVARNRAAAFSTADSTNAPTGWDPNLNGTAWTLFAAGDTFYVGGEFTTAAGQARSRLAAFTGGGTASLQSWSANVNGTVRAVARQGDKIYVGGAFGEAGAATRNRAAAFAPDGQLTDWNPDLDGEVQAIAVGGDTVYLGGDFTLAGGAARSRLAAVGTDGAVTAWNPGANGNVRVLAADPAAGRVFVGGSFTSLAGQTRNRLAAVEAGTGNLVPGWNPGVADGEVSALTVHNGRVYFGGSFSQAGGQPRNRAAASVVADTVSVTTWNPAPNAQVRTLTADQNLVYLGGDFTELAGQPRGRAGAVTTGDTATLNGWNPGVADGSVRAVGIHRGSAYLGGTFTVVGGQTRNRLAAIALGGSGTLLAWNPNLDSHANTVSVDDSGVYAGGFFDTVGDPGLLKPGFPQSNFVRLSTWPGHALGYSLNGGVGDTLPPGGTFAEDAVLTAAAKPDDLLPPAGKVFSGWNTAEDGSGTNYPAGQPFTMPGQDLLLYAKWTIGPAAPALTTVTGGNQSLTVAFTPGADNGATILGYEYSTDNGSTWVTAAGWSSGQTSFGFTKQSVGAGDQDLVNGTTYPVKLRAVNANGSGAESNPVDGTAFTVPATPVIASIGPGNEQLTVNLTPGGDGGSPITNYQYSTNGGGDWVAFAPAQTGTALVITRQSVGGTPGLVDNVEYQVVVKAVNAAGPSPQSNQLAGTPLSYALTFVGGAGTSGTVEPIFSYGQVTLPANSYTRNGFAFVGWNTAADGSGTTYQPFASYTLTANTTLYAKWASPSRIEVGLNGPVYASAVGPDGTVYLGGDFTEWNTRSGPGVAVGKQSGLVNQAYPLMVNGQVVFASVPDGSGGLYIGGSFTSVGGLPRTNLAHILADGTVDPNWTPSPNGVILTMQVVGDRLYLGGNFTQVNGQSRGFGAAVTTGDGTLLPWNPQISGSNVESLQVVGNWVYVVGQFTHVKNGIARPRAAAFTTGDDAALTEWDPKIADGIAFRLLVHDDRVYLGGSFGIVDGQARPFAASVNAVTGKVTTWNPMLNGIPWAMAGIGDRIYLGGFFTRVKNGSIVRNRAAAFSTADNTTDPTGWNPNLDNNVWSIWLDGSTIYLGGDFTTASGQPRGRAASFQAGDTAVLNSWNPVVNQNTVRTGAAVNSNDVYLGGSFSTLGAGHVRNRLAAFTADGALTGWLPSTSTNGAVRALLFHDGTIYAGGDFTSIGGQTRNRLAAFTTGGAIKPWNPNVTGTSVNALTAVGDRVFAGGNFSHVAGTPRTNTAAVTTADTAVLTGWDAGVDGVVHALTASGSTVYLGGSFGTAGGQARANAAAMQSCDPPSCGVTAWNPAPNGQVRALAVDDTTVYLGGDFTQVGSGTPANRNRAAAVSADAGAAGAWNPNVADNSVRAIAVRDGTAYLGGDFSSVGGRARSRLAAVTTGDTAVVSDWNPAPNGSVLALSGHDDRLFAAGGYSQFQNSSYVLSWLSNAYFAGVKPSFTLTFAGGAGTTGTTDPVAGNGVVTLPANGFVKPASSFVGWNTAADGSGTGYRPGDSFTLTAGTTLYASWADAAAPQVNVTTGSFGVTPAGGGGAVRSIAVDVGDPDGLADLTGVTVCLYRTGVGAADCAATNNNDTVKLTWTRSSDTYELAAGAATTWSQVAPSSDYAPGNDAMTMVFRFKVGEVARQGAWSVKVVATDQQSRTGEQVRTDLMNVGYYGVIRNQRAAQDYGEIAAGGGTLAVDNISLGTLQANGSSDISLNQLTRFGNGVQPVDVATGNPGDPPGAGKVALDCSPGAGYTAGSAIRLRLAEDRDLLTNVFTTATPEGGTDQLVHSCRLLAGAFLPKGTYHANVNVGFGPS